MAPFSYVTLILWVVFFLKGDFKNAFLYQLSFTIFISVFIEVGLFLDSELVKVEFWQITTILTFINALFFLKKSTKIGKRFFYYLTTLIIGLFILAVFPVNEPCVVGSSGVIEEVIGGEASFKKPEFTKFTIFYFLFAVFQAFAIHVAFTRLEKKDYLKIIRKLALGSKFIIVFVLVEIITRYFSETLFGDLVAQVFGLGPSTQLENQQRDGYFMLQGLTREGSHLVYSLFSAILILFVERKILHKKSISTALIIIGLIEIGLSMAFTSVLVYLMLLMLYLVYRYYLIRDTVPIVRNIRLLISFGLIALIMNGITLLKDNYFARRLTNALEDVIYLFNTNSVNIMSGLDELSSAMARFYSIFSNISLLQIRPLFGVGIGTNFSHGSTAWSLGETGLLGVFTYIYFIFYSKPVNYKRSTYISVILIWLLGNLFVSRPILMVRFDCFLFFVMLYLLWDKAYQIKLIKLRC